MAAANDLLPAVALVLPELVPFRRALTRLLHRPIGLSGSGPTLWAVYPSLTEAAAAADAVTAAVADGSLAVPGRRPAVRPRRPSPRRSSPGPSHDGGATMTREAISHQRRPRRDRTVQPGDRDRRLRLLLRPGGPGSGHRVLVEGGIEPETERVMANLTAVLEAAGCGWADVVKTTVFLIDMADFAADERDLRAGS